MLEWSIAKAFELYCNGERLLQAGKIIPYVPADESARFIVPVPKSQIATGSLVIALRVRIDDPTERIAGICIITQAMIATCARRGRLGRLALDLDRQAILRDRECGWSLGKIAKVHRISRTTVHRVLSQNAAPSE
jgi:hypothetical protein